MESMDALDFEKTILDALIETAVQANLLGICLFLQFQANLLGICLFLL